MTGGLRDVVVVGGSAGAVEVVGELLAHLPRDFEAAIAVTLHRPATVVSSMAQVFARRSALPVVEPEQGQSFLPGRIHLAPPDRHMTVFDGTIQLNRRPPQHHSRPAIDPLFQSAATCYGSRVIGVLLTGNLSDGVSGLRDIKRHGGLSVVQDPAQARFPAMPQNALEYDHVDLVFRIEALAELLQKLVRGESIASAAALSGISVPGGALRSP
jgi:two-component system, chemotaxis family, protein-glutamate methylesterase/glutaminase